MAPLVSHLLSPVALQTIVRENIDYDLSGLTLEAALAMAELHRSAVRQLQLVRPAEATAGGTGKGAGYSMVNDTAALNQMLERVDKFISLRRSGASVAASMFGMTGADVRYLQEPFALTGDCDR